MCLNKINVQILSYQKSSEVKMSLFHVDLNAQ